VCALSLLDLVNGLLQGSTNRVGRVFGPVQYSQSSEETVAVRDFEYSGAYFGAKKSGKLRVISVTPARMNSVEQSRMNCGMARVLRDQDKTLEGRFAAYFARIRIVFASDGAQSLGQTTRSTQRCLYGMMYDCYLAARPVEIEAITPDQRSRS